MTLRLLFSKQKLVLSKLQGLYSVILLCISISLSFVGFSDINIINPYATFFIVFTILSLILLLIANIYYKKLEMYKYDKEADVEYNPFNVYAFTPFQEVLLYETTLALLKAEFKENQNNDDLKKSILKVEKWLKLGYIPKSDFPKHLKSIYLTKKEGRIK